VIENDSGSFYVLDVGHGSCAAIVKSPNAILVDLGSGATVLHFLSDLGVKRVETIIISHADSDHLGGLLGLIASKEVVVDRIYVNADGVKGSALWEDIAYELDDLSRAGKVSTVIGLVEGQAVDCSIQGWSLEVVAPRQRLVHLGVGNTDREDRRITTNSISAVVRVVFEEHGVALCPGDLDYVGYTHLMDGRLPDLSASLLLMPHHGGLCGSPLQTDEVVRGLTTAVGPAEIVTSHGRRHYSNPLPRSIAVARSVSDSCSVVCTQMSKNCISGSTDLGLPTVSDHVSAGSDVGNSCGGTLQFLPDGSRVRRMDHAALVQEHAGRPLCS
jgi:beta-lactamase superfamily II metal-dependent hydrolase